jgi:ribosomal protein S8
MTTLNRCHYKWNINELLQLQREYELLNMTIQEIAKQHQRSEKAILCRLQQEGFIENWEQAKGYTEFVKKNPEFSEMKIISVQHDSDSDSDSDYESSVESSESEYSITEGKNDDDLNNRLFTLEKSLSYLSNMVKQLFEQKVTKNVKPKLQALRKQQLDRSC